MNWNDQQRYLWRTGQPFSSPGPRVHMRFSRLICMAVMVWILSIFWMACDSRPRPMKASEKEQIRQAMRAQHDGGSEAMLKHRLP